MPTSDRRAGVLACRTPSGRRRSQDRTTTCRRPREIGRESPAPCSASADPLGFAGCLVCRETFVCMRQLETDPPKRPAFFPVCARNIVVVSSASHLEQRRHNRAAAYPPKRFLSTMSINLHGCGSHASGSAISPAPQPSAATALTTAPTSSTHRRPWGAQLPQNNGLKWTAAFATIADTRSVQYLRHRVPT